MDNDDTYVERNKLVEWIDKWSVGRNVLRTIAKCKRLWHLHLDRYRLWDETWYRVGTWALVVVTSLILAEIGSLGWRFYHHEQEKRSQLEAEVYLARGDYRNASLAANRTLQFNPNNVAACRVMAALAAQANSASALDWLGRVAHIQPTLQNKLNFASASMQYQKPPYPFATKILAEIPPGETNQAIYQLMAAKLDMSLGRITSAKGHFALAVQLDPQNHFASMSVALLQLLSSNQTERAEGRLALESISTNGSLGAIALRGLVAERMANHDYPSAGFFSSELSTNPQATLADQFQNLSVLQHLSAPEFTNRVRALEVRVRTNEQAVAEFSTWMRGNGLVEEDLRWMMTLPNSMLDLPRIQMNRAEGYLVCSNWSRLREVASQGDWGDLEYMRFALVSHASSELGASEMADSNWQSAMKEARSHLDDLVKLLQVTQMWHLQHEREQLLLIMVKDFPDQRWAQLLVDLYFQEGNTLGLHQLYGMLNQYYPDNAECAKMLAATAMLLKMNLAEAFDLAANAYHLAPTNGTVAATYAYSLHLQDRDLQAIAIFKTLPSEILAQPSVALYYGIVLASAGKKTEAVHWLNIAKTKGEFLPEEQQLLADALASLQGLPPEPAR